MTNVRWAGLAVAVVLLSACGGGGGGGNAAAGRTFTYGAPVPASLAETQALDGQLAAAVAMQAQPDAAAGAALANFRDVSGTLLGDSLTVARLERPQQALRMASSVAAAMPVSGFDNPGCVTQTATSVTLSNCTLTVADPDGTMTSVFDGSVSVPAPGSLAWDLSFRMAITGAGDSINMAAHQSGTLEVTATTIVGAFRTEMDISGRVADQSFAAGVDESLDVDVTYRTEPPPACITGGTLEAKRVWTRRPAGVDPALTRDAAARVTWTGCGTGTVEFSQ